MWSNPNSQTLQVGMQNGTATLENSSAISLKVKYALSIWCSNPTLRYFTPKKWKYTFAQNICSHMHVNIFRGFVHNSRKMKQLNWCSSTDKCINQLHTHTTGILLSIIAEEWTTNRCNCINKSPRRLAKWKESKTKRLHTT